MSPAIVRDERELEVDLAADHLSYIVLAFGTLAVVAFRGFVAGESAWDLLALVILAGAVGALYRTYKGTVGRRWLGAAVAVGVLSAVAAAILAAALAVRG